MGKIIKQIVLVLIGFLVIFAVYAAINNQTAAKNVSLSEIRDLIDQEKISSITVEPSSITAVRKDSNDKLKASIGQNTQIPQFFKDNGISQEKLAETLGITFQQVQKYEKGVNRIGSSRLFDIAKNLNVPVNFFFDEYNEAGSAGSKYSLAEEKSNFEPH